MRSGQATLVTSITGHMAMWHNQSLVELFSKGGFVRTAAPQFPKFAATLINVASYAASQRSLAVFPG